MTRTEDQVTKLEAAARDDQTSVLDLARDLVRIPSRGGIDPYDPVLDCMASWLDTRGLGFRRLTGPGGATVARSLSSHAFPALRLPEQSECWTGLGRGAGQGRAGRVVLAAEISRGY